MEDDGPLSSIFHNPLSSILYPPSSILHPPSYLVEILMTPPLFLVLLAVVAYLVGSVPFGYLVARGRGVDILKAGSGNIGATNVGRVLGRGWGVLVFVLD